MIAFVMSGGANRGALEAGALLALFEAGIKPDMLVGTSAGSINATYIATDPTLAGARRLADIWTRATRQDFFPGGWTTMFWRLLRGRSLFSSDSLRQSLDRQLPPDKRCFGDLTVKLYITAANLTTGTLYLYGEQPEAKLIDAVMASTAHPLAYPPERAGNWQLVDGGVVANVPVGIAADKGATEIYILNVGYGGELIAKRNNVFQVLGHSISMMMYQHFVMDLKYVMESTNAKLHHISIPAFKETAMWELNRGAEMVESGYKTAKDYLQSPTGLASLPMAVFGEAQAETPPDGAQVYVPSYFSPIDVLDLPESERQVTTYLTRHGTTDTTALARALGRTNVQTRKDLMMLTRKGYVQCLPDGTVRMVFGRSRRHNIPAELWNSLTEEQDAESCLDE